MSLKRVLGSLALVVLLYLWIVPWFWPAPRGEVSVSGNKTVGLDVSVVVNSWHSNFEFGDVRWCLDVESPGGPTSTFCPGTVHDGPHPITRTWGYYEVNRVTWPRTRTLRLRVAPEELERGLAKYGDAKRGKIQAKVVYVWGLGGRLSLWLGHRSHKKTFLATFEF